MMSLMFGTVTLLTAGAGIVTGIDGVSKIDEAQKIAQDARTRYERKREAVERLLRSTQALAHEYSQLQIQIHYQTLERFVTFVDRIDRSTDKNVPQLLAGIEQVSLQQIQQYQATLADVKPIAASCLDRVKIEGMGSRDRTAPIDLLGMNSTETTPGRSISVASLGWLGGTLGAAGGATLAFGSVLAGGAVAAPILAIGGFVLGRKGGKSLAESSRYEEISQAEIAKLNAFEDLLGHLQRRIVELKQLVINLNDRAILGLREIELQNFSGERNPEKLQQVALLMKTLAEVMKTPVFDPNAKLSSAAVQAAQATAPLDAKYLLLRKPAIAQRSELLTASC